MNKETATVIMSIEQKAESRERWKGMEWEQYQELGCPESLKPKQGLWVFILWVLEISGSSKAVETKSDTVLKDYPAHCMDAGD